jgi:hypothetical protein
MTDYPSHYASEHAQMRAIQRLGFEPTLDEWREVALAIMDTVVGRKSAACLERKRFGTETWHVYLGNRQVRVVWSSERAQIITVLL